MNGLSPSLSTAEVLDLIFRDPAVKHGLEEFRDLGKTPDEILRIYPKTIDSGRYKGELRYHLKCFKRGDDIQVLSRRKSSPEEIVRQLWLYKLHNVYGYPMDHIEVEYPVDFGTVTAEKAADILVFQKDGRTAKIVIEVKSPDRKDGLNQLKSYLNAEGSPVGVWTNGYERVVLYRPYPREFEDTLTEIPAYAQEPKDVLAAKLTLKELKREFDFKRIIQNLEELVLANAGVDEFSEIFKIIFAKIFDENTARDRKGQEVGFRKSDDSQVTYATVDRLFRRAMEEWPGIFDENEHIKLSADHLQVVVGPLERIRLLGANMRVMDDAFEYLMPNVLKKKQGQFFTPRYVIDMCVKMLNPTRNEYVLDPACGSAGFLVHVMEYVWPVRDDIGADAERLNSRHAYAARYLWGLDFGENPTKVSRALMLIAGDGRAHVFKVNSLDPREWYRDRDGEALRSALRDVSLLVRRPPANSIIREAEAWDYYRDMKFDVLLTNPPFAGEIRDKELLRRYALAEPALSRRGKRGPKEERDVLFIERCLQLLKPGGRMAIVLPQGKLNNSSLAHIREWILLQARVIAVVGLHSNTFKPHTGTRTSVLFLRKHTETELGGIRALAESAEATAPEYKAIIASILSHWSESEAVPEDALPEEISNTMRELFDESGAQAGDDEAATDAANGDMLEANEIDVELLEGRITRLGAQLSELERKLLDAKKTKDLKEQERIKKAVKVCGGALAEASHALADQQRREKAGTTRGRLELLMEDSQALEALKRKWIEARIAEKQDYPVFMATNELGGKDASGLYLYRRGTDGALLEDEVGNPLVEQDCVKYRQEDHDQIAESFIGWAKKQGLGFWQEA